MKYNNFIKLYNQEGSILQLFKKNIKVNNVNDCFCLTKNSNKSLIRTFFIIFCTPQKFSTSVKSTS